MTNINNPIATNDQAEHEMLANEIFNDDEILAWRKHVRSYWLDLVKPSETMLSCFDEAFDEVMFGAVIWGLNQDPSYPKIITISRIPHVTKNIPIPGSRWGIDNPDSVSLVSPPTKTINDTNVIIVINQIFNDNILMFLFTFMFVKYNNFIIIK